MTASYVRRAAGRLSGTPSPEQRVQNRHRIPGDLREHQDERDLRGEITERDHDSEHVVHGHLGYGNSDALLSLQPECLKISDDLKSEKNQIQDDEDVNDAPDMERM